MRTWATCVHFYTWFVCGLWRAAHPDTGCSAPRTSACSSYSWCGQSGPEGQSMQDQRVWIKATNASIPNLYSGGKEVKEVSSTAALHLTSIPLLHICQTCMFQINKTWVNTKVRKFPNPLGKSSPLNLPGCATLDNHCNCNQTFAITGNGLVSVIVLCKCTVYKIEETCSQLRLHPH